MTTLPPGAYQTTPAGIPSLFRNTQFPAASNLGSPSAVNPSARTESVRANVRLDLPALSAGFPLLQRGFEPQDADLKVGPFFFKLRAIEGAVLHSDNINLTEDNRESGTIAIASVSIEVIAQITEGLRLATAGTLVYLPIEGKVGLAGFGLFDLYEFGVVASPTTHAQVVWNTQIGGWNVVFSDDFRIALGVFSDDVRSDQTRFDGSGFDEESRAGRYVFGARGNTHSRRHGDRDGRLNFRNELVVYSNTISAETERLLAGPIRLRARIFHEDLWYNQGNRGLPGLREGAVISLASERENLRFKPYATYEALRTSQADDFQHTFRLGIFGPITDQLEIRGEFGHYFGGPRGKGNLWKAELQHTAGPYTHESLIYQRSFNYFHDEVNEGVGYDIQQILGPKLNADAFVYRFRIDELGEDASTRDEWRAGVRFTLTPGSKTQLRVSGMYSEITPLRTETWTGRIDLGYNFTPTLFAHFVYQYEKSDSVISGESYTENLFFLSLTKYFE